MTTQVFDPWDLSLRRLNAFAMTARCGSVVAAAEAIHLSQPAVTQAVAALERALDVALFERRPDGMTTTPAAQVFLPRVEATLACIGSSRITSTQARAFLALHKAGAYVGASRLTGLAAPSLHRAIADLEKAVGRKLVERRGRSLEFTAKGRQIARSLSLAVVELEAGLSELATLRGLKSGRIAIGAMPLCRARFLPEVIVNFRDRHPEMRFAITEGAHGDLVEPLRNGDIDLMIGALRTLSPGPDVEQTPLFADHPVILARSDHPARSKKGEVALEILANYPWIVPAPGTPLHDQWRRLFEDAGLPAPAVPIECGSVIAVRQILLKTDCLTILSPDQVSVELEAGWLTILRETPPQLKRIIGFTTRTGWRPTTMQAAFIKTMHDLAASYPSIPPN